MAIAQTVVTPTGSRAILLDYVPHAPKNRLQDVREALSARHVVTRDQDVLKYHRFEPDGFEARLSKRLVARKVRRVVVDISTMSKLAILLVLNVCRGLPVDVSIFYAEARVYGPSQFEFERAKREGSIHRPTLQVFTGVHGVVRVDSLASVAMQGHPTAALVFMSFNDALTQVLLNTVYPSRLFLINSRPPLHSWREDATAWIHDHVRREWDEDNPVDPAPEGQTAMPRRTVSTLAYRDTVDMLLDLYWQLSANHRVLLAPAGSKMQAVGCFLVKALHPDIHIEYPSPEGFQPQYSAGIGHQWIVDFTRLSGRLARVADAERRQYLEIPT
jgi:hypothetical protein